LARYTGPKCRICRREGVKLFLKGERCLTTKCALDQKRRPYPPGDHGLGRKKMTDYGLHLREKQKVRRIYGMNEKQFLAYYHKANSQKGVTGENLLRLLERRLDSVVYRLGFAMTRDEARQLVSHRHFMVNGRRVSVPSIQLRDGDEITLIERTRKNARLNELLDNAPHRGIPGWLELDRQNFKGVVKNMPNREDIDLDVNERLIVELYSK